MISAGSDILLGFSFNPNCCWTAESWMIALRDSLRRELRVFPGVSGVVPAPPENGGDGASIVRLK